MYKLRVGTLCDLSATKWGTSQSFVTVEVWQESRLKKYRRIWQGQQDKIYRNTREDRKKEGENHSPKIKRKKRRIMACKEDEEMTEEAEFETEREEEEERQELMSSRCGTPINRCNLQQNVKKFQKRRIIYYKS